MKQLDIGYRELLERVLPLEELPPADRLRVQRALHGGITREIEDAALLTIARLEQGGALRRVAAPPNGGSVVMRFQPRDALELITVHLPGPETVGGITTFPRSSLPARSLAGLDQVRRLLRLDDPTLIADPRDGQNRLGLLSQLEQAGRELLGDSALTFHPVEQPANGEGPAAETDPLVPRLGAMDPALATHALANRGSVMYCPDATKVAGLAAEAKARRVRSLAVAGVVASDGSGLGHLEVTHAAPDAYAADDLARIALLADYCGGLLERAERIEKLVFIDPLTAVSNRAYFDLQAVNELARARRDQASVALCIADIDNFKSFNTAFGYEAGNQVLTQVAQTLRRGVRPFDTVARWGGEEFAVLLAAPVQAEAALAISERLRHSVERLRLRLEGLDRAVHQVAVTVSIGVALFPEHAENPQDLWRAANRALLTAKSGRKNEVVFYLPSDAAGA